MNQEELCFKFLDGLKASGATNMFGASIYLEEAYDLSSEEAREVILKWTRTYAERHKDE